MNRIILIGNGFDLAHGLKTSYKDFINWFWEDLATQILSDIETTIFENDYVIVEKPYKYQRYSKVGNTNYQNLLYNFDIGKMTIKYKNHFLQIITEKTYLQNWVDIEDEYFTQLKDLLNPITAISKKYKIKDLNNDFKQIKLELEKYLTKIIADNNPKSKLEMLNKLSNSTSKRILFRSICKLQDFTNKGKENICEKAYEFFLRRKDTKTFVSRLENFLGKFDVNYLKKIVFSNTNIFESTFTNIMELIELMKIENFNTIIKKIEIKQNFVLFYKLLAEYIDNNGHLSIAPTSCLFLNFNYTNTETLYKDRFSQIIHIHGELNNPNNSIIFGYGDEQDEIHKELEKLGGDYLENIKTINYTKTPNYKNLLNFIESGMYQVFVMGHSCSLSDKTLLNTLFEHENCVSIKPFYYIDENGHNNYDDIVKNIYRCFTNKALMREKVVNVRYCEELSK